MKFTSITTFASVLLPVFTAFSSVSSLPITLQARDVFVPPIKYPKEGTHWIVGQHHNVVWDTSNRPVNITNGIGRIMLRKGDLTTPLVLADDFDILLGKIQITVPWVEDSDDYQIVLFGDSGNFSPKFTISH